MIVTWQFHVFDFIYITIIFNNFQEDDASTVTNTPRSPMEPPTPRKPIVPLKPPVEAKPKTPTPPPPKREVKPLKPPVQFKPAEQPVEKPAPPPPKPRPVLPAAPPPREPTPPRPVTPLPEYITQFKGAEWFEKFFPNASENVSHSAVFVCYRYDKKCYY